MFKFLVKLITEIKDEDGFNIVCGEIDRLISPKKFLTLKMNCSTNSFKK